MENIVELELEYINLLKRLEMQKGNKMVIKKSKVG